MIAQDQGTGALFSVCKTDYEEIIDGHPEQSDTISSNLLTTYGFSRDGNVAGGTSSEGNIADTAVHEAIQVRGFTSGFHVTLDPASCGDWLGMITCPCRATISWLTVTQVLCIQQSLRQAHATSLRALQFAAMEGDAETVKHLIARGLAINAGDHDGRSSLHHAAHCNHEGVAQILLEKGADTHVKDARNCTPLETALDLGHSEIARMMIDHGARLPPSQFKRVFSAAENGNSAMYWLKCAGADINSQTATGRTALHEHCLLRNRRAVQVLLDAGADTNVQDRCVPCVPVLFLSVPTLFAPPFLPPGHHSFSCMKKQKEHPSVDIWSSTAGETLHCKPPLMPAAWFWLCC